jgi:hypothetical protein
MAQRMQRRGSKWWFENACLLDPSVPIIQSLVRDNPLDICIFATK